VGWTSQVVIAGLVIIEGVNDGLFVYNGAPAAGNLIASIASTSGTDPYGNKYLPGVTVYSSDLFANFTSGQTLYGVMAGGVPDTADAGSIIATNGNVPVDFTSIQITSPKNSGLTNPLVANFFGGTGVAGSGPTLQLEDTLGIDAIVNLLGHLDIAGNETGSVQASINGPAGLTANLLQLAVNGAKKFYADPSGNLYCGGNLVKLNAGTPYTAQTPSMSAGYTNDNCKYRQMSLDAVWWSGEISQTTGVSGAGAASVYTLPAGYRPAREQVVPASWRNSGGLSKGGNAFFSFETSGAVMLGWSATTANGDRFSCDVMIDLGTVP
jgi:hypothetical protein